MYATLAERVAADGFDEIEPVVFYGGDFSNFSRHSVVLPNPWTGKLEEYLTGEHRFQAMKATTAADHALVARENHPSKAKDRGRGILLRDGWGDDYGDLCWYVMVETVIAKARQHPDVMETLRATGMRPIYEDSPTDPLWGVRTSPVSFDGKNLLGRAWMDARAVTHS